MLLLPRNAASHGEPYTSIQLKDGATIGYWPSYVYPERQDVAITGIWGWPVAIPGPIREATVLIFRQIRDLQKSGMTMQLEALDQQIRFVPGASTILKDLQNQYRRRGMVM